MLGVARLNSVRRWLLSRIQFVTYHTIFEIDSDLARGFNNRRYGMFVISQKQAENVWKRFCSKNGGGPKGPRKRGALAPHFFEKSVFRVVIFSCFWKQQNALAFPNWSWVIHLIKSVSRMFWILSNGMHARSLTHWCESNNTEHSLACAISLFSSSLVWMWKITLNNIFRR